MVKHQPIDLFEFFDLPLDYQWDKDPNAKLLNIVFHGATFGNFLKFFLDKFSKLTPDIPTKPFSSIGATLGKNRDIYSGLIQKYHLSFMNQNKNEENLPVCIILPTNSYGFLYLKMAQWYKSNKNKKLPDDLWKKSDHSDQDLINASLEIKKLYRINDDKISKSIVRDWYRLEFLERLEDSYNYRWFDTFRNYPFLKKQRLYILPLESFFSFDSFLEQLKLLDKTFNLQLDFNREKEMETIFTEPLSLDICRQQNSIVSKIVHNLTTEQNMIIPTLDVSNEAFIYAEIEKRNPGVVAPRTDYFFKDTNEIRTFITKYPI